MTVVKADSAGFITQIPVKRGDLVAEGAPLVVTELMKMHRAFEAPFGCRVEQIHVAEGAEVSPGDPLITISPADALGEAKDDGPQERADLREFLERLALTSDEARPDAVAKRHAKGRRTARENVEDLFDPDSFLEYGALAVAAQRTRRSEDDLARNTPADGIICGTGTVQGRPVAVMAVDYSVLAGTQGYFHHRKMDRLIEVAKKGALPIVLFAEGGGGRPNDDDVGHMMAAWLSVTSFRHFAAHKGPKIGIAAGYCFAGNAALFGVCDVRIATEDSCIGMGGPAMIEGGGLGAVLPTDVGPSSIQRATGVIDVLVASEGEAVAAAKALLGLSVPQASHARDMSHLRQSLPTDRTRAYDMREVIEALIDPGSGLELRADFGVGMMTWLGRIDGRAVGLLANNPLHLGGAIDAEAADSAARFMQLCDAWGLPLVTLCDTPGFMVGPEVETTGQVAHVSRMFLAGAHFQQPLVTVLLRKAYGLGAMAMAGGGFDRPQLCCAWPSAELGAMGLEGAVKLGYREKLAAIKDPAEREATFQALVDALYDRGKAISAAQFLEFDAVIDPAETVRAISRAFASAGDTTPGGGYVDAW